MSNPCDVLRPPRTVTCHVMVLTEGGAAESVERAQGLGGDPEKAGQIPP